MNLAKPFTQHIFDIEDAQGSMMSAHIPIFETSIYLLVSFSMFQYIKQFI